MEGVQRTLVSEPTPDFGENRYLVHFTSEIFHGEESVGYILFTRYAYGRVRDDRIPFKWLIQPHSYMSMVSDLVIGSESRYPDLPLSVSEVIDDSHGHVYIIDEVTCNRSGLNKQSHLDALSEVISFLKTQTDAVLISDAESFARYLSDMKSAPLEFWSRFEINNVEGRYLYSKYLGNDYETNIESRFPEPF